MNLSSPSSIYAVIFYSLQFIFGIPGNVLIIVVYMKKKRKISTDILIIAQGIIDLVASLLAPINIIKSISDRFTITVICRIALFGNNSLAFASLFLTAAIALDRFFFVCRPYGKRTSNNRALCLAVACWVLGSSLTCTKLIFVEAFPSNNGQKTCHFRDTLHIFDKLEAWLKTSGFVLALVVSSVMYRKIYQTIRHQAKIHAQLVGGASKRAVSPRTAFQLGEGLKQPEIDVSHAYDSGLAQSLNATGEPSDRQEATAIERCPHGPRTSYLQVHRSAIERDPMTNNSVSSAFDNYRSASQLTLTRSQANTVPVKSRQNSRPKVSDRGENRTTKMLMANYF
ncbi:C5a anaphylatoxin chemotactic receptor 1-like [Strongylocentrotus purpuratus]|uniref:G-protein coupled receptors family 1 profile domain-containing protein n=1 Tax=Strongylocentrotus purpuratus TaxID=7668 RepID=A0A7M7G1G6_STRPU|nr:C5a anaphylatoxin chemotactic receptor 1-like [Strongylocentrotus purpuratus]